MSRATAAPDPPRAKAPSSPGPGRWVYFFGDGHAEGNARMRDLLGGKGAGIAEMVLTGKVLGLDSTMIAGFQLMRILIVLVWCRTALFMFRRVAEWTFGLPPDDEPA